MRDMGIVQGSGAQAQPLIVGKDTVYVHAGIAPVPPSERFPYEGLYQYHEIQYGKDEYIQLMAEKNTELEGLIDTMLGVE